MSQEAKEINEQIDKGGLLVNKQKGINYNWGGGASRPRLFGSIGTFIKEVYKSANKKK